MTKATGRKKSARKRPRKAKKTAKKTKKNGVVESALGLIGPRIDDDGTVYLSKPDLAALRIVTLEHQNARKELELSKRRFLDLQTDAKNKFAIAQQNIKESEEAHGERNAALKEFFDDLSKTYALSDEDRAQLTYDEVTGKILICDAPLVREG